MKKLLFTFLLLTSYVGFSQNLDNVDNSVIGTVETISGYPIYMYSHPMDEYLNIGKPISFKYLKTAKPVDEAVLLNADSTLDIPDSSITQMISEIIDSLNNRYDADSTLKFNAINVHVFDEKVYAMKFESDTTQLATIKKIEGISIFLYAKPNSEYDVIAEQKANYSEKFEKGMIHNKVKSMVKHDLFNYKNGEFNAIIVNPSDLSHTLIKLK